MIFSSDSFKSRSSIETITTDWFPPLKATSKREEITSLILAMAGPGAGALQGPTRPTMVKVEAGEKKKVEPAQHSVTSPKRPPLQPPDTILPEQKRRRSEEEKTVKLVDIVSKLKLNELKKELSDRGLAKSGKKEILAARLLSYLEMEVKGSHPLPRKRKFESLSSANKHFKSDEDYKRS